MDISVLILAKNEAEMIADAIVSVQSLSPREILVIDDFSTDDTVSVASSHGANVLKHAKSDFAEARNFAARSAKGTWLLYLDADERLSLNLQQKIKEIAGSESSNSIAAFNLTRKNYYLGKEWPASEHLIRLIHKPHLDGWYGVVHESPQVRGTIQTLTEPLIHYTHRSLSEMVENTIVWSEIEARLRFDAKHPRISWWRIPRIMIPTFFEYYITQGGWKVGTVGLIESMYQAFSIFITYARLWEMQQKNAVKARR